MKTKFPKLTTQKCRRCGSRLLLVDQTVETVEGQYGAVTTSTYHCSNIVCQAEFDRELAKLLKAKKEKDIAQKRRAENMIINRKKAMARKKKSKS